MIKKIVHQHSFYLFLVLIVFSILVGIKNPVFFSLSNTYDILKSSVVMGLFAIGVLIVIISGGIDISFTAIAAFSMYLTSKILLNINLTDSLVLAFMLSGIIGLLLGTFNAVFISHFKLPTLIVTLGTASVFRGFMLAFIGTSIINNLPESLIQFSKFTLFEQTLPGGERIGLSVSIFILILFIITGWLLLRYTMLGRGIYAMGGDRVAAQRAGFNLTAIQYFIYGFVGFLSGIAGIIYASMMRNSNPFDLVGTELIVIAAVVLGGASITGGKGTMSGTVLGVLLLILINSSLILLNIPSYWQKVTIGLIIIIGTGITVQRNINK
jgi:simple sugar transport system permease protein